VKDLRFALLGCGFWSRVQLAAWREVPGARCVALYNRTRAKAERLAAEFGIPAVYDDAGALLDRERPDFVDIVTDPSTHARFAALAAGRRVPAICQKPLAPSLQEAEGMAATARASGVPLLVHENWRWQAPIRELKRLLDAGTVGRVFRTRLEFSCSFPVFEKQPFLRELDEFILADVGVHVFDAARYLFGEADAVTCLTRRVHPGIRGEDVATALLRLRSGATAVLELSYASLLEHERFPQTYVTIEGERGSIALRRDYEIRVTTAERTTSRRVPPPRYAWADPAYDVVHASIVPCHANLLAALRGEAAAETTAEDNLKTLRLVFGAYASARSGRTEDVA
jgi:D-apiose dehydrogenase